MEEAYLKEDLIDLRKSLALTQQEMANRLGMALRSYQAIEAGESEYRFIHRLAAERVALALAVDRKDAILAPTSVRRDAVEFAQLAASTCLPPEFDQQDGGTFQDAYAIVGELVLMVSALDHQLNHVLIQVLHLTDSPLLESVVATLDMTRKIEMLKERSKHLYQPNWKRPLLAYLDKLETVSKWRNIACHTVLNPNDKHGAAFVPTAAAKLLKALRPKDDQVLEKIPISDLRPQIKLGESALFQGLELIENFQRANAERIKRFGIR
jgi:transcriptional regulator with XRE-family HTH domain